jgi:hypothetical protein
VKHNAFFISYQLKPTPRHRERSEAISPFKCIYDQKMRLPWPFAKQDSRQTRKVRPVLLRDLTEGLQQSLPKSNNSGGRNPYRAWQSAFD